MNPIGASHGFQLVQGQFEPKHLEKKTEAKLEIAPKNAGQEPALKISETAATKLSLGTQAAGAQSAGPSPKVAPSDKVAEAKKSSSTRPDPKLEKVAHEFEAIFVRNLLKPLEKAGSVGKEGSVSSGGGVYGSMMVGALADSASSGGGIGLAHLVLEALTRGATPAKPTK